MLLSITAPPGARTLGLDLITPEVHERLEEADLLKFARSIRWTICATIILPRHSSRCAPRAEKSFPSGVQALIQSMLLPVLAWA